MNVTIYDIETLKELFLLGVKVDSVYYEFEISQFRNDIDAMIIFLEKYRKNYYWVGYNNLRFDSQVIEYIYRNWENWHDLSGLEICAKIAQVAQDTIHDANFDVFPKYRESDLSFAQIDLFKIHHFDNKNRRVSLKRLEFEMDFPNIEEMPIHHTKVGMTKKDIDLTKHYCKNDVEATEMFYYITIGETENSLYKGDNKIEMRLSIEQEFGIPCLNFSNAKIGDEIIKKYYCEETNTPYNQLPKKGFFRKEIKLKYCIPSYIKFQTKELQKFLEDAKKKSLKMSQDFVHTINFRGQEYTFAKGGLHNVISGKIYEANEHETLEDVDVGGYYPAIIINNSYFPFHLGKSFLVGYSKVYNKRIELKPLAKKDKRIKGIVGGLKEAGNCPYGKSSDMDSWLFDKQMTLATCLTGEFSLLMLIEDMELNGIRCIMANTDGATFIVPKDKRDNYEKCKKDWLLATTKNMTYVLEEVSFKKMIFSTVNDYIGIKEDGEVKYKGDFLIDFELHKNKSARIVNIALDNFYTKNIPVEETIINHKNLFDFCIRQKASKSFHYEGVKRWNSVKITNDELKSLGWIDDPRNKGKLIHPTDTRKVSEVKDELKRERLRIEGRVSVYDKLIRYYISETGEKILRIKNPECHTRAAKVAQTEAGEWLATICNRIDDPIVNNETGINYKYYIERAERIIYKITTGGKKQKVRVIPTQYSLF